MRLNERTLKVLQIWEMLMEATERPYLSVALMVRLPVAFHAHL